MRCFRPLAAYQSRFDKKILFSSPPGRASDFREIELPCGRCTGCRLEQSRQWASRIVMESKMHEQNCFVTLTYDNEHLPEYGTLVKSDLTNFFKRLRKNLGDTKIRYYAVGEYGDRTHRPHYHAIIFGTDFSFDRKLYKNRTNPLYESELLSRSWQKGFANLGDCTFESAAYCARYCLKKVNAHLRDDLDIFCTLDGELVSRQPEYAVMSRRPGIGRSWWDKYGEDTMRTDRVVMRGREMLPPRYFDKLFSEYDLDHFEDIKDKRALQNDYIHSTLGEVIELRQAETARSLLQSAIKRSYE